MTTVKFVSGADSVEFDLQKQRSITITIIHQGKHVVCDVHSLAHNEAEEALRYLEQGDILTFCQVMNRVDFLVPTVKTADPGIAMANQLTKLTIECVNSYVDFLSDPVDFRLMLRAEGKEIEDWGRKSRISHVLLEPTFVITVTELKSLAEALASTAPWA